MIRLIFHNITLTETDDQIRLQTSQDVFVVQDVTEGLREAFRLLQNGVSLEELKAQTTNFRETMRLQTYLRQFARFIIHMLYHEGVHLASLIPNSPFYQPLSLDAQGRHKLSRFAYLQRHETGFMLESPKAYARVWLKEASLLDWLEQDHEAACLLRELVSMAGMMEPENDGFNDWTFHDLLFLTKTRERFDRSRTSFTPKSLPAIKPPMSDQIVALYQPDIEKLRHDDLPFTAVLENRQSIRHYQSRLTAEQLGEFLYRSARVKAAVEGKRYETTRRVYPSAGACYMLEIYPVIYQCEGIEPGFYHYCPQRHVLEKIEVTNTLPLLQEAVLYTGNQVETPQVLFIMTARFDRILWKYDSTALSLILKDVGGLFQTMYLVATAMKLAPCAIGVGNSDLFARATGIDYYTETSVGEFLLGS